MGDEIATNYIEGVANPNIVAGLKNLAKPPKDAELLARLIDGIAGHDVAFQTLGLSERTRAVRQKAVPALKSAQKIARKLTALNTDPNLDLLELAIEQILLPAAVTHDPALPRHVANAVALLSSLPLHKGAAAYAHRPPSDQALTNVVLAVKMYFGRQGVRFSGGPRVHNVDGRKEHLLKGVQAELTRDVLKLLGMEVTLAELGTLMRSAIAGTVRKKSGKN